MPFPFLRVGLTAVVALLPFAFWVMVDMGKRMTVGVLESIWDVTRFGGFVMLGIALAVTIGVASAERLPTDRARRQRTFLVWCIAAALWGLIPSQGFGVLMVPVALVAAALNQVPRRADGAVP